MIYEKMTGRKTYNQNDYEKSFVNDRYYKFLIVYGKIEKECNEKKKITYIIAKKHKKKVRRARQPGGLHTGGWRARNARVAVYSVSI